MNFKIILGIALSFLLLNQKTTAQEEVLEADSTLSNLFYEVGFGFSNLGEMVVLGIDEKQIFPEHDKFSFSLSQHLNQNKHLRFGFVYGFYKEKIAGGYNRYISPFIVTIGLEKKKTKNRWVFSYGSDIYYATSLKRTNVGGAFWQAEQHAFGISGLVSGSYFIRRNLSVRTETEIGFGARNDFKNKGFVVQQTLAPEVRLIKAISLELKYHF